MGKKIPTLQEELKSLTEELYKDFERWKYIFFKGCTDPSYEDGVNLNLVRNHIIYHKRKLERLLDDKFFLYPDSYYWPTPKEVPFSYMAVSRKIPCRSKDVVQATDKPFEITW